MFKALLTGNGMRGRRPPMLCALLVTGWILFAAGPAPAAHYLKIGLLEEPKTLNIWLAGDTWSRKVLSQIYQPLYLRDPETLRFVPWLAAEAPILDQKELCYTVKLRPAKWSDGTALTSRDVAFTARLIQEFKIPRYISKWRFVKRMETPDSRTVKFYLSKPKAIFLTRTLATPIVQESQWRSVADDAAKAEKPLKRLLKYEVKQPVGSGPFVLKEWRQGAYLFLRKNPHFFAQGKSIAGMKLGPFIDGLIFKIFGTSDAAVLALKKGSVDMFWWGIQPGYLEDLRSNTDIRLFSSEKSALYYMGLNLRRPPFNDLHLRRAVATLIDKNFIISRILQGYGAKMHSMVPPGNRFYYCDEVRRYGDGLDRTARVRRAYEILKQAGYRWETPPVDEAGRVVEPSWLLAPDGRPVPKFSILTPPADYDPNRAMCGMIIQEWLRALGMPASAKPMAFGSLIQQVKVRRDFDAFILAYGNLSLDPDYLRSFFHSRNDRVRGRNTSGYHNPEFDRVADAASSQMDRDKRRALVCDLQKMLNRDLPWIPLYNPNLIEAVRRGKVKGWVQMLGGIGNLWSFCRLKPL
ncbi:MAG: ABC transporter substrate-binding protein [Deltaproteobacteria bacterium]|nr:ABC transporter substrate-binding protein [Deltaproteobacteria bacterium]MBW1949348.1 ABC transporter substrate-binding protein [Deltaproteobacteria bacterium]MBW2007269.1 ABC transporter substrate-binding protein [Deltaproteobacteria bacterium]MBW2347708.1 ABC transporter substrate-binding protein [Deltaproteobacteria bacterium]